MTFTATQAELKKQLDEMLDKGDLSISEWELGMMGIEYADVEISDERVPKRKPPMGTLSNIRRP